MTAPKYDFIENRRKHDPFRLRDGFMRAILKGNSPKQVEDSLDREFEKHPKVKYPNYPQ